MSIESRQPGRPTVEEFTGAALRFLEDDYPLRPIYISTGMYTSVFQIKIGQVADFEIMQREALAEGLPGVRESVHDFALRQLAWYVKSKNS